MRMESYIKKYELTGECELDIDAVVKAWITDFLSTSIIALCQINLSTGLLSM